MAVLVTGANGFVGRHLMTIVLDAIPLLLEGKRVDLCDESALTRAVKLIQPRAVIHLAGEASVASSIADPVRTYAVNFGGTLNLLTALKAAGFTGRFLYISSGDVYGAVPKECLPVKEDQPVRPRSPYAVSKIAAEALCYQWSQTDNLDMVIARPFNHIGPGQGRRFAIADFARQIIEMRNGRSEPILRTGDVDVTRDFTDVRDVVLAYKLLLERGCSGQTYNVCSSKQRSVRSLIEQMMTIAGVRGRIEIDSERLRKGEHRFVYGSNERLQRDTGWSRQLSIETSLRDILQYWETIVSSDPQEARTRSVSISGGLKGE